MSENDDLRGVLESLSNVTVLLQGDEIQGTADSYLNAARNYLKQGSSELAEQALQGAYSAVTNSSTYRNVESNIMEYSSSLGVDGAQVQQLLGTLVGSLSDGQISQEERNQLIAMTAGLIGTAACAASGYLTAVAPLCGLVASGVAGLIAEASNKEEPELKKHTLGTQYYLAKEGAANSLANTFKRFLEVTPSVDPAQPLPNGKWLIEKAGKMYEVSTRLPWRPGTRPITYDDAFKAAAEFTKVLNSLPKPANLAAVRPRLFAVPPSHQGWAPETVLYSYMGDAYDYPVNNRDIDRNAWRTQPASQLIYRELLRFRIDIPSPDGRPVVFTHYFSWCLPLSFAGIALGTIRVFDENSCWAPSDLKFDVNRPYTPPLPNIFIYPWFGDQVSPAEYDGALIQYQRWMGDCSESGTWASGEGRSGPGGGLDQDSRFGWTFTGSAGTKYVPTAAAFLGMNTLYMVRGENRYHADLPASFLQGATYKAGGGQTHEFLVVEWLRSMALGMQTSFAPYVATKTVEIAAPFFEREEKRRRATLLAEKRFDCWRQGLGAEWRGDKLFCKPLGAADVEAAVRSGLAAQPARSREVVRREMMVELETVLPSGKNHPRWAAFEAASQTALLPATQGGPSAAVQADQAWGAYQASQSAADANQRPLTQAEYQSQVASSTAQYARYQAAGGTLRYGEWASAGSPASPSAAHADGKPAASSGGGSGGGLALLLLPVGLLGALALGSRK